RVAVQAGRAVDDAPLQVERLRVLALAAPQRDRREQRGAPLEPAGRRLLRIAVVDRDALALAGQPAGDVGGERGFAAAALRIRDQDRLHDRPLPRTGRPDDEGRAPMVAGIARNRIPRGGTWLAGHYRLPFPTAMPLDPSTLIARTTAGDAE